MNRKLFIILIILMSFALVGIVLIQGYWIKTAIEDKEEAFSHSVRQALSNVTTVLEQHEINRFALGIAELKEKDSLFTLKGSQWHEFMFVQENKNTKETFIYKHGILEEDYSVPSKSFTGFDGADSTTIKNYTSKQSMQNTWEGGVAMDNQMNPSVGMFEKIGRLSALDKIAIEEMFRSTIDLKPINDRITPLQLDLLIRQELLLRKLDIDFEYAIYRKGILSNVRSKYFNFNEKKEYKMPLFFDNMGEPVYELSVIFPEREQFLLSSVIGIASLSIVFTVIIIVTFSITVNQLITQRKISQIKTDFINNMTHEFKTPIAVINLVLDTLKNPMNLNDPEKVLRYVNMLRDENKRMHSHVENILQISKLEKGELNIEKEPLDAHDLIENAIAHVHLMVEDRQGNIRTHLEAENSDISANESHFTNVLVNIMENAIKYSPNAPEIDIYTQNVNNQIIIRIQDKGQGMSKAVLKKVFDKFYREHTGDLHNVKGHGLGLAYVKSIVKNHNGMVYAESEKGKGSSFIIKMPVI
ncbi:sensor histidine kinase [Capnocytophaga canimorsus]|uniref:sensor histidine kinase n=1 Tax=Capnocytophaga canimorsus TaxID=28188 RepID=UPI003859C095